MKYLDAAALNGKTISSISLVGDDRVSISTTDGKEYVMFHSQDCCESVAIYDILGNLQSLVGLPLTVAREEVSSDWPEGIEKPEYLESFTWTTYFFETEASKVYIRWYGSSNGWYSESVQLEETN